MNRYHALLYVYGLSIVFAIAWGGIRWIWQSSVIEPTEGSISKGTAAAIWQTILLIEGFASFFRNTWVLNSYLENAER